MPEIVNPTVIVLGGVNGAGKTTASRSLLANTLDVATFVNADVIARGLSGFDPDAAAIRAGEIMLDQLRALAARRANFAFETTLAARSYAPWLNSLRESGYDVHLFHFWLSSANIAIARGCRTSAVWRPLRARRDRPAAVHSEHAKLV
jgi:predicted ABC-type ATPase